MGAPELSVVVPAYNEEARLQATLDRIFGYLEGAGRAFEVVVVDDGSTDRTAPIAAACRDRDERVVLISVNPNRGKGYAVRTGMLAARGRLALLTDADLSSPIQELARLEEALSESVAVAFGSRDCPGARVEIRQSAFRERGGKLFNVFVRVVTGLPYFDTQCGFKLFRLPEARALFETQRLERFAFDVELIYLAHKWGLGAVEVPVLWRHAEGSKVRFFPDGPRALADVVRVRLNDIRGLYQRPRGERNPGAAVGAGGRP